MKHLLVACALFVSFGLSAQNDIKFKELKHSFGKIKQNKPVSFFFSFTNESNKPLIVENAVAGCGCTTPDYPKEPIGKGKEAKIKVTYNAAATGPFKKDVTVKFANHPEPIVLLIDGEVIAAKAE
ncbi:DUF1573 domain-containing protein [Parasediminibacterium sp. JCM 36343]|uniref:DUF1573 domain-containing protein n=1 Tax=Parasediminibacterium sp. JCM 36343 TaxID=3374279 RepID=UPI0039793060